MAAKAVQLLVHRRRQHSSVAHLITSFATPFNHFWYSLLVQRSTRLADLVDDRGVGLERVECSNGILLLFSLWFYT